MSSRGSTSSAASSSAASAASAASDVKTTYDCIGNVANWSKIAPVHLFDKPDAFIPEMVTAQVQEASPKLFKMLDKIKQLDAKDMEEHKHKFKHMIFAGNPSTNFGAKIVGSVLLAHGYDMSFHAAPNTGLLSHSSEHVMQKDGHNSFSMLLSKPIFGKPMTTYFKKRTLEIYNSRPENVHGDLMRFIVLDGGFREGIDLFDVKYIHLLEPTPIKADERQAIGRGTRFCGQKGIFFDPKAGWPLHVYRYEVAINQEDVRRILQAERFLNLQMRFADIDPREVAFADALDAASVDGAVDKPLTKNIRNFKVGEKPITKQLAKIGGAEGDDGDNGVQDDEVPSVGSRSSVPPPPPRVMHHAAMAIFIKKHYNAFKYPIAKLENGCIGGSAQIVANFTPTQDFMRHYFQPSSAYKGILAFHSVGSGKSCTGIATASTSFEKEGYTILWVTRHTLKADIAKNLFGIVCSIPLQDRLKQGLKVTKANLSNNWVNPISYKQFSNLLLKRNKLYGEMVKRNGATDPLKKTLIVIDEAHKLYAPNTSAAEKPNMNILETMLQNSYADSGDESARLLLMTATPYTKSPLEMIKLLNLMRPKDAAFPTTYDEFAEVYLNNYGDFTGPGKRRFFDDIAGYISNLDRSSDARNFAYPVIHNVVVNMSETKILAEKFNRFTRVLKDLRVDLREAKKEDRERTKQCVDKAKEDFQNGKDQNAQGKADAMEQKAQGMEDCNDAKRGEKKSCKDEVKATYDALMAEIKAAMEDIKKQNAADKEKCKENKTQYSSQIQKVINDLKAEYDAVKELRAEYRDEAMKLKIDVKDYKQVFDGMDKDKKSDFAQLKNIKNVDLRKKRRKELTAKYAYMKRIAMKINMLRQHMQKLKIRIQLVNENIGTRSPEDMSQESALRTKCYFNLPDRNPKKERKPKEPKQQQQQHHSPVSPSRAASSPPYTGPTKSEFTKELKEGYKAKGNKGAIMAYRKLTLKYHPDKHPNSAKTNEAIFKVLQNAWDSFKTSHNID